MTTATQLTITIPEGAPAGSILSIPVKGSSETIRARVPEGLGPGCTLVLTKVAGSDQWVEESVELATQAPVVTSPAPEQPAPHLGNEDQQFALAQASPSPVMPVAYTVRLDTTVGSIDIIVRPDWAPHGARRFLELAAAGDLEDLAFYRAVRGCLAQFGLPARRLWPPLLDDAPTGVPFLLGAVCFAAVGQNSRKSTLFICTGDMSHCFGQSSWETPIGAVAESSLDALDRIETCYGDIDECGGQGPNTGRIHDEGTEYLRREYPRLTHIRTAWCLDWPPPDDRHSDRGGIAALPPLLPSPNLRNASPAAAAQPKPQDAIATNPVPPMEQAIQQVASTSAAAPVGRVASDVHRLEQRAISSSTPATGGLNSPGAMQAEDAAAANASLLYNRPQVIDVPIEIVASRPQDARVVKDVPVEVCASSALRQEAAPMGQRLGQTTVGSSSMSRLGASVQAPLQQGHSQPAHWSTTSGGAPVGPRTISIAASPLSRPSFRGPPHAYAGGACCSGQGPAVLNSGVQIGPCRPRTSDSFTPPAVPGPMVGVASVVQGRPMVGTLGASSYQPPAPQVCQQQQPLPNLGFGQFDPFSGTHGCPLSGFGGMPPLGTSFVAPVQCGFPSAHPQFAPPVGAQQGPPPLLTGCPPYGRGPFDLPGFEQPGLQWPGAY